MKKIFAIIIFLLSTYIYSGVKAADYVSPEFYAVNEADLTDYKYVEPSPKLNIDNLENMRFKNENKINKSDKDIKIDKKSNSKQDKPKKEKKYEEGIIYKSAKWWVDQRYKREESHHGTKHEIKVKTRKDYEKRLQEERTVIP